ncbi:MAG: hypothetical protein ABIP48_22625 [Planctomycetota bacterium]
MLDSKFVGAFHVGPLSGSPGTCHWGRLLEGAGSDGPVQACVDVGSPEAGTSNRLSRDRASRAPSQEGGCDLSAQPGDCESSFQAEVAGTFASEDS